MPLYMTIICVSNARYFVRQIEHVWRHRRHTDANENCMDDRNAPTSLWSIQNHVEHVKYISRWLDDVTNWHMACKRSQQHCEAGMTLLIWFWFRKWNKRSTAQNVLLNYDSKWCCEGQNDRIEFSWCTDNDDWPTNEDGHEYSNIVLSSSILNGGKKLWRNYVEVYRMEMASDEPVPLWFHVWSSSHTRSSFSSYSHSIYSSSIFFLAFLWWFRCIRIAWCEQHSTHQMKSGR